MTTTHDYTAQLRELSQRCAHLATGKPKSIAALAERIDRMKEALLAASRLLELIALDEERAKASGIKLGPLPEGFGAGIGSKLEQLEREVDRSLELTAGVEDLEDGLREAGQLELVIRRKASGRG